MVEYKKLNSSNRFDNGNLIWELMKIVEEEKVRLKKWEEDIEHKQKKEEERCKRFEK